MPSSVQMIRGVGVSGYSSGDSGQAYRANAKALLSAADSFRRHEEEDAAWESERQGRLHGVEGNVDAGAYADNRDYARGVERTFGATLAARGQHMLQELAQESSGDPEGYADLSSRAIGGLLKPVRGKFPGIYSQVHANLQGVREAYLSGIASEKTKLDSGRARAGVLESMGLTEGFLSNQVRAFAVAGEEAAPILAESIASLSEQYLSLSDSPHFSPEERLRIRQDALSFLGKELSTEALWAQIEFSDSSREALSLLSEEGVIDYVKLPMMEIPDSTEDIRLDMENELWRRLRLKENALDKSDSYAIREAEERMKSSARSLYAKVREGANLNDAEYAEARMLFVGGWMTKVQYDFVADGIEEEEDRALFNRLNKLALSGAVRPDDNIIGWAESLGIGNVEDIAKIKESAEDFHDTHFYKKSDIYSAGLSLLKAELGYSDDTINLYEGGEDRYSPSLEFGQPSIAAIARYERQSYLMNRDWMRWNRRYLRKELRKDEKEPPYPDYDLISRSLIEQVDFDRFAISVLEIKRSELIEKFENSPPDERLSDSDYSERLTFLDDKIKEVNEMSARRIMGLRWTDNGFVGD